MAHFQKSPRDFKVLARTTATGHIGPGEYFNEGKIHKLAMQAIFPKKYVPFNANVPRWRNEGKFINIYLLYRLIRGI